MQSRTTETWDNTPEIHDFRNFVFLCWEFLGLPEPTPLQYEIAGYLQSGDRRICIQAYRGAGKSWLTSVYVIWYLLRNPDANVMVVSASKDRADAFSVFTQRLIREMPLLAELKPSNDQRDSMVSFDVGPAGISHAPSVTARGITGQLTGSRADLIVADDVESRNNSETQGKRDVLLEATKEFAAIIKPGNSQVVFLGTPQTEESIYHTLVQTHSTRIWPSRYPKPAKLVAYGDLLAPSIASIAADGKREWEPTDPLRFDDAELMERELVYGRSGFALQFMLDPSLSDAERYPLRLSDLIIASIDNEKGPARVSHSSSPLNKIGNLPLVGFRGDNYYAPESMDSTRYHYDKRVLVIDPAGKGKDETAYAVGFSLNGVIYIPEAGGIQGGFSAGVLQHLADLAKKHKVNQVLVEENFGSGMFAELLKPYLIKTYPVSIEEVRHSVQKERRICDVLEPIMNQHRLVIDPKVIEHDFTSTQHYPLELQSVYRLFYQMTRITRERGALKHDDRLDALSMCVQFFVEDAGQLVADAADRKKEEAWDAMLARLENDQSLFGSDAEEEEEYASANWRDDA